MSSFLNINPWHLVNHNDGVIESSAEILVKYNRVFLKYCKDGWSKTTDKEPTIPSSPHSFLAAQEHSEKKTQTREVVSAIFYFFSKQIFRL